MIKAENLTKFFNDFKAVDDISFEINKGQIIGLLGPNGAGKTTTLRILTGYFNPTLGNVNYDDLSIIDNPIEIKQKIGYLPENNPLYEDMKVKEYLKYAAEIHNIPKADIKIAVNKVIESCHLQEKQNQEISKLSKGFKQRVGLAQALLHNPEILILDEPTEGLDPNQRIEIRDLIKEIGQEKTVILSSHVLSEVEATCDQVLIINKGKIVASGTPQELSQQATSQTKIFLTLEGPIEQVKETLSKIEGVERILKAESKDNQIELEIETDSTMDLRKKLISLVQENGWQLLEIYRQEKSLEDIFINLTN